MVFKCNLQGIQIGYDDGKPLVTFKLETRQGIDEIPSDTRLKLKVEKYREKRSLNANNYAWKLIGNIADKMNLSPVEVYRGYIRDYGIYKDFPNMTADDAKTLQTAWGMLGLGWIAERLDYESDGEHEIVRCYYGSSKYNTKQMSRLIDAIVEDCRTMGIQTETPEELARIKEGWSNDN